MHVKPQWTVTYPENSIICIEAFRNKLFDYEAIAMTVHDFFQEQRNPIRDVCELGAGTGPNLFRLTELGYRCLGVDSNRESVELARNRAAKTGADLTMVHMDFNEQLPDGQQDALLVLFVPLAITDMHSLALRASSFLRPGGYFMCIMLAADPTVPDEARHQDAEYAAVDDDNVVRLNFYEKKGNRIEWDAIYVAGNPSGTRMYKDHDTLDLLKGEQNLDLPVELYDHVKRLDLSFCKATQRPPMTIEVLDIYRRKGSS